MYRKRFVNRKSSRKAYARVNAEASANAYIAAWYPKANPTTCKHSVSFCPWSPNDWTIVCEDCGVEMDAQHNVIGKGVSRG